MDQRRKALWVVAVVLLLFFVAIGLSNLTQPRRQDTNYVSQRDRPSTNALAYMAQDAAGPVNPGVPADSTSTVSDRKLIRNAELGLTVADVRATAEQIRRITEAGRGEIDNLEITESGGSPAAVLVVRVPESGIESALTEYKKLAVRTDHEQLSGHDVTREFYDNEAHMRNLRAEEEQCRTIMKQAHTLTDILAVSEKLSDVRDRIERLQAQIQVMTHDIAMPAVSITLTQESDTRVLGIRWRPLYNAKVATRELLVGLGDWMDWAVALLIRLPLILLWTLTVGALVWIVWKIGRSIWLRLRQPENSRKGTSTRPRPSGPSSFQPGGESIP